MPSRLEEPAYPAAYRLRRVQKGGQFRWASHYVFLTRALHGEVIGLEALDEREYRIWFEPLALGVLDSCQEAVRPAVWLAAASTVLGGAKGRRYAPSINIGGGVNAASFTPAPDNFISPNAIISIFGKGLSLRTRRASRADLMGGRLPVTLGGVSVKIGGVLAPLYYVSPNQINAQAPSAILPGSCRERSPERASGANRKWSRLASFPRDVFI